MNDKAMRVLLVEDNEDHVELIRRSFDDREDGCFILQVATSLSEALPILAKSTPDLMIVDYRLPDGEGVELLPGSLGERELPIIMMTGHGDQSVAVNALKSGAIDYIVKSTPTMADMANICDRAMQEWRLISRRRQAIHQLSIREAQIKSIFQAAPTGIFVVVKGKILFANEHLCDMLSYQLDELIGKNEIELFHRAGCGQASK